MRSRQRRSARDRSERLDADAPLGQRRHRTVRRWGYGFDPNGVASDLRADKEATATGGANTVDTSEDTAGNSAGTGGGAGQTGVNGSSVALPFGLDPATTPVMGSYGQPSPAL
ncbi:arabinosyltransferase C-terminal domain-containing protein [Rhodococcus sp. 3Y1]